jgi:hypothetical protein
MDFNIDKLSDILNQIQRLSEMDRRLEEVELKNDLKLEAKDEPKPIERPKRCQMADCKAKIVLSDFACQCKKFYCSMHRYSESHSCSFDYRAAGAKVLEKNLVKTIASKLDKV